MVPLMNAADTVRALEEGRVDFGVLAYTNNIAGDVVETAKALDGKHFDRVAEGGLLIHHCVFAKRADADIDVISSHIHALNQCRNSLGRLYPSARWEPSADTAYSAQLL